ncbi:uncharacterized protein E0L32_004474 [Thyridium curvatum]|uniref:Uncharacterized protein n=1 Tax=Thyridium curvatum TaxID=1093900 RepID=A0A507BA53_9PEZI|nr:uncharacterized protein E0L32_004474 [Thyridium curvatum]TPX15494.1 hypothetical protein E0L32_004474 [Thyridium curvatum]
MPSLLTVNNNVSLLTVNIAPSTFLASLTLSLVFLSLYLPRTPALPSFPVFWKRKTAAATVATAEIDPRVIELPEEEDDDDDEHDDNRLLYRRPLPALPAAKPHKKKKKRESRLAAILAAGSRSSSPTTTTTTTQLTAEEEEEEKENRRDGSSRLGRLAARLRALNNKPLPAPAPLPLPADPLGLPDGRRRHRREHDDDGRRRRRPSASSPLLRGGGRGGLGLGCSGFWRKTDNILGGGRRGSRESSPGDTDDEVDDILARAARTRLPTGSVSPEKERSPEPPEAAAAAEEEATVKVEPGVKREGQGDGDDVKVPVLARDAVPENYIRFAVRAEVLQRTEPVEAAVNFVRRRVRAMTRSWAHLFCSVLVGVLSLSALRSLFSPAAPRPVPDLVKVAGIARSFEPLIYYSESGVQQVGDLQATGVAVWDLGESVRSSNMTSAPIIVRELDALSDSLKALAVELTRFFANVDGDVDSILIVMDWARRELAQAARGPASPAPLAAAYDNIHNLLSAAGVLEDAATGRPTRLGALAASLFGPSSPQRARAALQRTFAEFLAVLEDAIASELQHSLALFALFEAIDRQFLNLARAVAREVSAQDERHADLLSGLWTRILGPRAADLRKYERNRDLLRDVRERTVRDKGLLVEHNHRLLALKASLESLRRKLVSPLVRGAAAGGNGSGGGGGGGGTLLGVEEQIRGLEDVGVYLEGVRTRQKSRLMEVLYGADKRRGIENVAAAGSAGSS